MAGEKIYEFLVDTLDIEANPEYGTLSPFEQLLFVNAGVSDALLKYVRAIKSEDLEDDRVITDALLKIFDKYIVPIKLTNRPMVEMFIESQVRGFLPGIPGLLREHFAS